MSFMRKYRLLIVIMLALLVTAGCAGRTLFYNIGNTYDRLTGDAASVEDFRVYFDVLKGTTQQQTVQMVANKIQADFTWEQDAYGGMADYPRNHLVMLKRKKGDCEDYSNLMARGLQYLGLFKPSMLFVGYPTADATNSTGHVVCLVQIASGTTVQYYHISNWKGVYGPYKTVTETVQHVHPQWTFYEWRQLDDFRVIQKETR